MIYGAMIRLMLNRVVSSGSLYKSALIYLALKVIIQISTKKNKPNFQVFG